jgi:hypothetical protein
MHQARGCGILIGLRRAVGSDITSADNTDPGGGGHRLFLYF